MNKESRENKKKFNNDGFSLVEVLVAVIILALVAGPILMAFVMSARFNARARENQRISVAAESVMEDFKGLSIKQACDPALSRYTYSNPPATPEVFVFAGDKDIDGVDYDVRVTATPLRDKEAANLSPDPSNDSIIEATVMNPYDTYVYNQSLTMDKERYDEILNNVYEHLVTTYSHFQEDNPDATPANINKDNIYVERHVYLVVDGDESAQTVYVYIKYNYQTTGIQVGPSTYDYHVFTPLEYIEVVKNYKGLKNAYVFFSPGYKCETAKTVAHIRKDTFKVLNNSNVDIDAYFIRLNNHLYGEDLTTPNNEYKPDPVTSEGTGSGMVTIHQFIRNEDSVTNLYKTRNDSLMYSMKVEIFSDGAKDAGFTEAPLYTLDGSINSRETYD